MEIKRNKILDLNIATLQVVCKSRNFVMYRSFRFQIWRFTKNQLCIYHLGKILAKIPSSEENFQSKRSANLRLFSLHMKDWSINAFAYCSDQDNNCCSRYLIAILGCVNMQWLSLGRLVHTLNQKEHYNGCHWVVKFSKFVPPNALKMHSLALSVNRFFCKIFSKLLKFTLQNPVLCKILCIHIKKLHGYELAGAKAIWAEDMQQLVKKGITSGNVNNLQHLMNGGRIIKKSRRKGKHLPYLSGI